MRYFNNMAKDISLCIIGRHMVFTPSRTEVVTRTRTRIRTMDSSPCIRAGRIFLHDINKKPIATVGGWGGGLFPAPPPFPAPVPLYVNEPLQRIFLVVMDI